MVAAGLAAAELEAVVTGVAALAAAATAMEVAEKVAGMVEGVTAEAGRVEEAKEEEARGVAMVEQMVVVAKALAEAAMVAHGQRLP